MLALSPGTRLDVYEVLSLVGSGGMGEVYRARDTRLGRDIALKILPTTFKSDPERLARFRREAQLLASLNHPHIAAIHGVGEAHGMQFLVLELVDGESLDRRIARGPVPVEEALAIAAQIATALEAAHEQGIIHRDLKPANIKVRADGTVKVLDFGLAKGVESSGAGPGSPSISHSPTITTPAMSYAGVIIGTAAYMSPEQAKGRPADKRSDVWSFGVVLYEMLTGRRAFKGDDVSDTLALILTREPEWAALRADVTPSMRRIVRRCLARDPRRRMQAIGEARAQIEDIINGAADESASARPLPGAGWRSALPWAIAAAVVAVALAALWLPRRATRASLPLRVSADLGGGFAPSTPSYGGATALSPDSTLVAFVAQSLEGRRQLYIRRLSQLAATPLSGTDDADSPFFSPDGRWIGFFAAGKMKKIAVTGGTPFIICDTPNGRGGTWGADGTIVFSPDGRNGTVLMRVSSNGGTPEALTALEPGEIHHRWPQFLPGGKGVLFTANSTAGSDNANLVVQAMPKGPRKVVHRGGSYGRYLASGHLAFAHQGALFVAPFDLDRLEETGAPVRVVDGIATNSGGAQFDVSPAGILVYQLGTNGGGGGLPMQWMDREGRIRMLRETPASWVSPRFSPDGSRLAVQMGGDRAGIWIYDVARDALTRLSSDAIATNPVWTPDGRRLTFSSAANGVTANIYWRPADGTREAQRLTTSENTQYGASWHPSGKFLAFEERNPQTGPDLMILPMEGDEASGWKPGRPTPFVNSPNAEREPMFSPDGRWIAYWSNDSGRYEIYVKAFGGSGGVWQISTDGGEHPAWSPTTRELFYSLDGRIMAASYVVDGDSFRAEKPKRVAETRFAQRAQNRMFDIHPRGERFMLAVDTNAGNGGEQTAVFVFDFFNELRQLAPAAK